MNRTYPMAALLSLVCGCATGKSTPKKDEEVSKPMIHLGDSWYRHRGSSLGMTSEQVKERDAQLSDEEPPNPFWDEQLAIESASIWRALCNECHEGRRSIRSAAKIPAPGADWGTSEASFFGRIRPHRKIFQTIFFGGEEKEDGTPSRMPAWGERISREQIWGLVYYIEKASEGMVLDNKAH